MRKCTFWASALKILELMRRYACFYDGLIETFYVMGLYLQNAPPLNAHCKVTPRQTLTSQGFRFGRDVWMASFVIHRSPNLLKIDR